MKTRIDDLLIASTDEVFDHCVNELLRYYPRPAGAPPTVFVHKDDFVYAPGHGSICLVSHIDTVRDRQSSGARSSVDAEKPVALRQNRNVLTNANGILGADDRAGVFACLDLVRRAYRDKLPMPSVMFFNGEESGGLGVKVFLRTEAFKREDKGCTKLFVEMDRLGATEWVTYGATLPRPVIDYVESFGFKSGHGSYSDIADLQEEYLIPSVNLSIGYYGQHTQSEKLHLDEMHMTINRVYSMMKDPIAQLHPVTKKWSYQGKSYDYSNYGGSKYKDSDYERTNGGQKNVSGGRGNVSASASIPPVGASSEVIDLVLNHITWGGYCKACGDVFADCTCGSLLAQLLKHLEDDELTFLMDNYLTKEDPMYEMLEEYIKAADAAGKVSTLLTAQEAAEQEAEKNKEEDPTKDPFHVGKEGDPIPADVEDDK